MFDTYINACEDIIYSGFSKDKNAVADAIREGYIIKEKRRKLLCDRSVLYGRAEATL